MSNNTITSGLSTMATAPLTGNRMNKGENPGTWFEALADAWGQTLDGQANRIEQMSNSVSQGGDNPSQITQLTAESLKMSFLSNSSSSSIDSVGKALETMARKG
ncbi:hypothetical protein M0208_05665 [Sphingomonas sp. SUN019]|uniref:hypothetical protein n=1 Tax=Sphingomonas sp. SUN019 TaxID=2937788 RepID=UPI00216448BD|nr:hypothetical protein [Sphingomonas sp. SUN019]UVO50031.1 hypothetical protein M0208_05665 [Sphingomonas sp. SUN019]